MVDDNVSVEYDEKQRWIGMMWCVLCMQDRENNIISGNVGISLKGNTVELGESRVIIWWSVGIYLGLPLSRFIFVSELSK
jgi:hypothetical protein